MILPLLSCSVNGTSLAYWSQGQGDPIVFVHGSVADIGTFAPQFAAFSARYSIVAYSRRFHPPNAPPPADALYDARQQAEDLFVLLQELGLGRVHLVGSSYGGYVTLLCALAHPAVVRTLVLGEPPMLRLLRATPEGRTAFDHFQEEALIPSRHAFEQGKMEAGLGLFLDGVRGERGSFQKLPPPLRTELMRFAPEMCCEMMSDFDAYMPPVDARDLERLQLPVLLVNGEASPPLFHIISDQLLQALPGAEQVTIPRAPHIMHAALPQAYSEAVLSFLSRRGSASTR